MNNPTFIKGYIYGKDIIIKEKFIFRIINFNNTYFFAEEISSKCIFPIHNCFKTKDRFTELYFSYLKNKNSSVFLPLISDENFGFILDQNDEDFDLLEFPEENEIQEYLKDISKNLRIQEALKSLEMENEYMCNINIIKEKIAKLQINDNSLYTELDMNATYESPINFKPISNFGYNLSEQDNLCNTIGREEEIKRIIKTTCIRENSVLLVGEPGCGKTSIVEKMALDIKQNKNPWLNGKIIFYLSLASVQNRTKYRGELEEHFEQIINFCKENKGRVILFIDEIHNLYGLGKTEDSANDGMNILKPYISNGTIIIIGATTKKEYEKYMTNDEAFLRRFEKIDVTLPDEKMNIEILLAYIKELEEKYNIKLDFDDDMKNKIVKHIVEATNIKHQRKIGDVNITNPTISKYILADAFAEALYNRNDFVCLDDVCYAITSCDKLSSTIKEKIINDLKYLSNNLKYKDDNNLPNKITSLSPIKKLSVN